MSLTWATDVYDYKKKFPQTSNERLNCYNLAIDILRNNKLNFEQEKSIIATDVRQILTKNICNSNSGRIWFTRLYFPEIEWVLQQDEHKYFRPLSESLFDVRIDNVYTAIKLVNEESRYKNYVPKPLEFKYKDLEADDTKEQNDLYDEIVRELDEEYPDD